MSMSTSPVTNAVANADTRSTLSAGGSRGAKADTIGVAICTYNEDRLPMLLDAVASVRRQTLPPEQLVVVVDGPERLATLVRRALPDVTIECLGRNRGVGVARNTAVSLLSTDAVAFLDDDAVADPEWLERLAAVLVQPGVLGVGGRAIGDFGRPRPAWLPPEFLWVVGCSYRGMPTSAVAVRNFYGGCALVRRDVFTAVDGYQTGIGHTEGRVGGGEEADFCVRAQAAYPDGTFWFEPAATIQHRVPSNRLTWRYFIRRCFDEGVMKAGFTLEALGPEVSFALEAPRTLLGLVRRGQPIAVLGQVAGAFCVLAGLVAGRLGVRR